MLLLLYFLRKKEFGNKIWSVHEMLQKKKLSTKNVAWKLFPDPFVFIKN